VTDLLLKYEERLKSKREISQMAFQKFTSELFVLESEVDKKHRDRYKIMKGFAQDFLNHQSEGMEMMAEITRGVYEILEKMAED
jgi:vacuolar-type H+-ATPase subunit D/Vma8